MKFGRRLRDAVAGTAEAPFVVDYKSLKRAIAGEVEGSTPGSFAAALAAELAKVDAFYRASEADLEGTMAALLPPPSSSAAVPSPPPRRALAALRADAARLQRFAALNYVAVVKACKKRDRRLGVAAVGAPSALTALSPCAFFASPRLAALTTAVDVALAEADMATAALADGGPGDAASPAPAPPSDDSLDCAVCLGRLRQPVVLTCGHRFCWGCATGAAGAAVTRGDGGGWGGLKKEAAAAVCAGAAAAPSFWPCPSCRKPQQWTPEGPLLEVSPDLERLLATLGGSDASTATAATALATPSPPSLLPPKPPGTPSLTVVLDLDGTLIASFPPARAGALLAAGGEKQTAYVVGHGSTLNPGGVLVVERPGLGPFLRQLATFAEVVMFTAGLEDYAAPIADALFERYGAPAPSRRLFRPATTAAPAYPCVKDLSRLGRDPARTLLVDDTPLAFLAQPDAGVPVLPWRGDGAADGVLLDALLPLLRSLAEDEGADVRPVLDARFRMGAWFEGQKLVAGPAALARGPPRAPAAPVAATPPAAVETSSEEEEVGDGGAAPPPPPLMVFDYDHTLTDADVGEEVVSTLAPELAPQLATLAMPACFVPLTNAVLSEAARRGVCRAAVLAAARRAGAVGLAGGGAAALRAASRAGADVRILSDANEVFIGAGLAAAGVSECVGGVVTNGAAFEPLPGAASSAAAARHRLVVSPRHPPSAPPHACPLCPENLCKGRELAALRRRPRGRRVVYAGDGENDVCPALGLTAGDALLVRSGRGLERLLRERAEAAAFAPRTPARADDDDVASSPLLTKHAAPALAPALAAGVSVYVWERRDELAALVGALLV